MKSSRNDHPSSKQQTHSPSPSPSQSMKDINTQKLNKFGKCFHIVDSPQIVFDLCDKAYLKSREFQQSNVLTLDKVEVTKNSLEEKRKVLQRKGFAFNRTTHGISESIRSSQIKTRETLNSRASLTEKFTNYDDRKFYQTIRDRLKELVEKVQNQTQIMISQVMLLKQDILASFFSEIIEKSKRECRQKGQLIHYIWNSMFSILELALRQTTREKNLNEKVFLTENIENHKKYQDMLDYDKEKIITLKEDLRKAEVFNNTLVFNLRCKRRELRKSYIKLKICTNKLNEYKENFLDLQREHIDLIMQTRDISKEMAQFLFKRRQEILQDKKKNIKLKFNKKANYLSTKKQIQNQPAKDLELINDQLKAAFGKEYEKEMANGNDKKFKKLTNFLFQDVTDQFAFYQNNDCIEEDLIANKTQTQLVDAQTDMIGFQIQMTNQACQVDYLEKIVNGMARNSATQTYFAEEKPKKIFAQRGNQINITCLNKLNYQIHNKVYDLSFLFEGKRGNKKKLTITKNLRKKPRSPDGSMTNNGEQRNSSQSIKFPNGVHIKSGKSLTRKISEISQLSKYQDDEMNDSQCQERQSKCDMDPQALNEQYEEEDSDDRKWNLVETVSKFALRKAIAKNKKTGVFLGFDREKDKEKEREERYSTNFDKPQELMPNGFVKTRKTSRFSRMTQRFDKNMASSLQPSPSKRSMEKSNHLKNNKKVSIDDSKHLKRETISRRQNNYTTESKVESNLRKMQLNSNVMKLMNKTIREHVDSIDASGLLSKLKGDNPNFVIDEEMQDFFKDKEDEEKERFFKNFSESISPLIMDLDKNIETTKRYHKALLPARHKNLCRIISNVYMQAYQLIEKKEKLYSLINPLFKYFEMGYGMLKKYDLYSRMISFLSHVCIHKEESFILYSFYFFTGIDRDNPLSVRVTSQDFELYLKLLRSLSFNFNVNGLNVQNLFTSNLVLEKCTKEVLIEEKMSDLIIDKVLSKVQERLQRLTGVDVRSTFFSNEFASKYSPTNGSNHSRHLPHTRSQSGWSSQRASPSKVEEDEIKLDVFKCCQLIMEEIIMMRKVMEESYLPLISMAYEEETNTENIRIDEELLQFIIRCQFKQRVNEIKSYKLLNNIFKINSLYNEYKAKLNTGLSLFKSDADIKTFKTIRTLKSLKTIPNEEDEVVYKDTLSLNEMCTFFIKANIFDFNKTYYNALNIFKLREEAALSMCIKRLPEIRKFFEKQNLRIELILLQEIMDEGKTDELMSPMNLMSYEPVNAKLLQNFTQNRAESTSTYQRESPNGLTLKHIHNKKILILCFLRFLESQVNDTVENMFNRELKFLQTFIPMSKIKS